MMALLACMAFSATAQQQVSISAHDTGKRFDGIGAVDE